MRSRPSNERILANLDKPVGSFWRLSKLASRALLGEMGAPTREQYAAFADLMFEGDALADALAEWMLENGVGRAMKMLDRVLREGIEAVADAPAPMRALFASVDAKPVWLDEAMLLRGQRAVQRTGALMPYMLGDITLVGGYLTMSAMNKSLVATGGLAEGSSERRLFETLSWWLDVTGDHGLDRNAAGFASTLKVRVMHALVRARLAKDPGWRFEEWGAPLSQAHLATTNQAFGVAYITLGRAFGVDYSRDEREAMMHLWRYAGFLMGVREEYCCSTEREGFRLIALSTETSPPPDEDAARLAEGYFEAELDFERLLPTTPAGRALGRALTRFSSQTRVGTLRALLGPSDSRALRLPPAGLSLGFPVVLATSSFLLHRATAFVPGRKALEARAGRSIHLGIKRLSRLAEPVTFTPFEHREGKDRVEARALA